MVLQTIGGLITLFAAIFAAWYAKSAAEEARRGATAAERGVTHATEVSQTELRASLKSEHETFKPSGDKDREYIVALKIRNVGQTPAHGLVIYADAVYISNKGARAPFPSPPTYIGTLVHDADIDNPSTILLTARQLSAITNKRARVHINYRITFLDDFKVSWVYYQDLFVDHRSLASGQAFTTFCRQVKEEDEQKEMEEAAREAESAKGAEDQGATPEAESEGEDELALVGKDPGQV